MGYDWRNDDVEARVAEDDPRHVGTYGLIWFQHPYSIEHHPTMVGTARGRCRCGWVGDWMSDAGADMDAEWHIQRGDFAWDRRPSTKVDTQPQRRLGSVPAPSEERAPTLWAWIRGRRKRS